MTKMSLDDPEVKLAFCLPYYRKSANHENNAKCLSSTLPFCLGTF